MFAGSVQRNHPGSATSWLAGTFGAVMASRSRLLIALVGAALLVGLAGLAVFKRSEIADLVARTPNALGEGLSAARNSPLAKSMAALLDQRSPGERTQGELVKDKKRYAAVPKQRALGKIRPALPAPFVNALTTPVPEPVPVLPSLAQTPLAPALVPAAVGSSPPVFVGGGGGGGGGGNPPTNPPEIEVPPVVVAVPEPSTWLTMMLGFFFLAHTLRKQRRVNVRRAALAA